MSGTDFPACVGSVIIASLFYRSVAFPRLVALLWQFARRVGLVRGKHFLPFTQPFLIIFPVG